MSPEAPGEPLAYHELHRAGRRGWWRPIVGVAAMALLALLVVPAVLQVGVLLYLITQDGPVIDEFLRLFDLTDITPFALAFINVTLAALIPITFLLTRVLHGLRPRWLTSVMPRMRWRYLLACLGVAVLALIATVVVSLLLPSQPTDEISTRINDFDTTTKQFALVVLLLTPLQAAGEEYAFRGYLTQVFGGLFGTWIAVLGPAVLFALAHGAQSAPVFFDRFAFGVVAGILVIRTGGLEAGIAMHVLNNWLAFSFALSFGDMSEVLTPSGGTWWSIPVTLTQSLVYLWLALLVARRMGLARTADPTVLVASRRRV
ncbi:CPBP family intramembrane metalloprotease [Nocardioides sp. MJB4]|uniref:CPBP family intramembrane metalloprotease n=2 Tax=Nocardioides donggukensis TaxID=2774019 RepID=A0A927K712_9ACTN|nr:CPBP family intramembrane metalloprotease [Nocardioides donggukensis]